MGLIEAFEEYLQKKDRSAYTVNGYVRDLQTFFAWLQAQTGKEIPPGEVTVFDVKRYRDELADARKKPATVNRALSALRQFFDWMVAQGHMASSPAASVKQIRVKRRRPKSLSKQEVYLLQRTAAARRQLAETQAKDGGETEVLTAPAVRVARRDEAILSLLLYSGIRVGELVDLRLSDVEIGERSGRVKITGKGRKYREVPLNVNARHALKDWLEVRPKDEGTDHFFVGKGGPMTSRGVQQRLNKIGDAAGVKVTPHVLRHTFATRLLREAKVDIVTTSNLMGHENIATTTIYTQPTDADLEKAVAKL
jgi:site-specific recombinase XerD